MVDMEEVDIWYNGDDCGIYATEFYDISDSGFKYLRWLIWCHMMTTSYMWVYKDGITIHER